MFWKPEPDRIEGIERDLARSTFREKAVVDAALVAVRTGEIRPPLEALLRRSSASTTANRQRLFSAMVETELRAVRGDLDGTLAALTQVDRAGGADIAWFARCPVLAAARADDRSRAVRESIARRASDIAVALRAALPEVHSLA